MDHSLDVAQGLVQLSGAMSHVMQFAKDEQVKVKSSDKMWSTGEGSGTQLQYSFLEKPNGQNEKAKRQDNTGR